jgi:drug/metabolite transporter (DMT)-like permease
VRKDAKVSASAIGLGCLLFFAISQGVRDAFFGNVFQSISFLLVACLAFSASTLVFTTAAAMRRESRLKYLLSCRRDFIALNATNAAAWLSFFFGLRYLEPAVVAALYNGIGPLAVLSLQASGWMTKSDRVTPGERACYSGIAISLAALIGVVLTNRSGLATTAIAVQGSALAVAIFGGVMIAVSHVYARRFNDKGVGSDAVLGTRFLLTLGLAALLELALGSPASRPRLADVPYLTATAFALVVVPGFMLQLGIARASPLAVNVFRALGPVFVFAVQQFDGRLRFSGATLACIMAFCMCAIIASLLRAWNEAQHAAASSSA